jgi:ribosomal protein S12 methylthiotransferase accessory factor
MRTRSPNSIPKRWWPFVGPKLGLAKGLRSPAIDPDDFDLHHVFPTVTSLARLLGHQYALNPRAGGAGIALEEAIDRAMGELLERYASFAYDGASPMLLSYSELTKRSDRLVPLEYLRLFSPAQYRLRDFPFAQFAEETRIVWFEGINLLDGLPVYVPAKLISLGYSSPGEEMPPCFYPTSSGCAVATSLEEALVKGILELIERDAVMVHWYARLSPPLLDLDPADLLEGHAGLHREKLELNFHDLTVNGEIPVVSVTCLEKTGRPCFFLLSAAAALDVRTAARKALVEAGQGRPFLKLIVRMSEAPEEGASFDDFDSNLRFYAEPANARYLEWFLRNRSVSARKFGAIPATRNPRQTLEILLDWCVAMAVTPIAFDLTTPEMLDARLFACRVFVPELVPMCVPSAPFLGHPRLARSIASHKMDSPFPPVPDWVPHPFP